MPQQPSLEEIIVLVEATPRDARLGGVSFERAMATLDSHLGYIDRYNALGASTNLRARLSRWEAHSSSQLSRAMRTITCSPPIISARTRQARPRFPTTGARSLDRLEKPL